MAKLRLDHVGFVPQFANLIPALRVRDQLLLVAEIAGMRRSAARQRSDELLATLGLTKRSEHYPEQLSGGERRWVAIVRALMNDPEAMVADEPSANLDSARGRAVIELLAREVKEHNKAGLLVTHDEWLLDLCDRVVDIVDGRLLERLPV